MRIECFYFEGCDSKGKLKENIHKALAEEGIEAQVSFHKVSVEDAQMLGIPGSPTVRVDGRDLEPELGSGGLS
jgi:hypothetical protein